MFSIVVKRGRVCMNGVEIGRSIWAIVMLGRQIVDDKGVRGWKSRVVGSLVVGGERS
jgi:hypothetical protein